MSPEIQTIAALVIVAVAATWLSVRVVARRRKPGCGGDCGCPASEIKVKLRH